MELQIFEPSFCEKSSEGAFAPKLDVPTLPQRISMRVPFSEQRDHQILEVTMIRRRTDEASAWLQSFETGFGPRARRVEVLDNLSADYDVERRFAKLL